MWGTSRFVRESVVAVLFEVLLLPNNAQAVGTRRTPLKHIDTIKGIKKYIPSIKKFPIDNESRKSS